MQHNLPKYLGRKLRSDQFLFPKKRKTAKNLPNNLHGLALYKIVT